GGRNQARAASDAVRVREPEAVPDVLSEELKKLASLVEGVGAHLDDEQKIEFTSAADRARLLALGVTQWLAQALPGQVYWVETTTGRGQRVDLLSAPIEVGPALKEQLYDQVPSVILTSATLSTGGKSGFRHVQGRLGLDGCPALQLGSPFDFRAQV